MALVRPRLPSAPDHVPVAPSLDGPTPAARRDAARLLAADPGAADALATRLAIEGDASVREAILAALSKIATPEAVDHLFRLLDSDDVWLRNAAIEALQEMDAAVIAAIEANLAHPDSDRRILTVNVLVSLRHPAAADLARRTLAQDPHVNVCAAALDVLAEVGTPEMAPEIEAVIARFPDEPFLHFAAKAALRRLA